MRIQLNPFQYGRELAPAELVDREQELHHLERTIANRGKVFLIGPRRYGKTSLLVAAAARAQAQGVVVLRVDAEKYESLPQLAQALLNAAVSSMEGTLERAAKLLGKAAARLRPELTVDAATGAFTVTLGASDRKNELPVLADALDAIEQMALESDREVVVMLDEVQQIVIEHGLAAEKQLRATVQRHQRTSYVFAGSATRLLNEMTSDPNRPFYRLGSRIFIDRLPRPALTASLMAGFAGIGEATESACEYLIERAEDVPYNVQRLAYEAWELMRSGQVATLDRAAVDQALELIVKREDAAYTQIWVSLKKNQKKALRLIVESGGARFFSGKAAQSKRVAVSSLQRALEALLERNLVRPVQESGATRYVPVDPFLGVWLQQST